MNRPKTAPAAPVAAAAIVVADSDEPVEPAPAAAAVAATEPAASASSGAARLGTEDVEGIGLTESREARRRRHHDDRRSAVRRGEARRPRADRGGHGDQPQADPRMGRHRRSHARPRRRPAVQRPARGPPASTRPLSSPSATRQTSRSRSRRLWPPLAGHRPADPDGGRDRGMDRRGRQARQGRRALTSVWPGPVAGQPWREPERPVTKAVG